MTSGWKPPAGHLRGRKFRGELFRWCCVTLTLLSLAVLALLLYVIGVNGIEHLDYEFLTSPPSRKFERAGIYPALIGTVWLALITALISIPIGVGSAIYLEEFARKGPFATFVDMNISNLAGVPSIVFGILGLTIFIGWAKLEGNLLTGSLTMSLIVLPMIIIASREALRAVPNSIRLAAYAIGATRWQTVRAHVLPSAMSGIMTGIILSISRSIGETAPLILLGAIGFITKAPSSPFDDYTVLPLQIYSWASRPAEGFHHIAASAIIVLLVVLLALNALAIFIRHRTQKEL